MAESEVLCSIANGVATVVLNRPQALNSLNQNMVERLLKLNVEFSKPNSGVSCVLVKGAGGKAFCAGGDVKTVVLQIKAGDYANPTLFFQVEYTNNLAIARLPIPYVALIDGIVMGGGVGASIHGAFRVATERTVFAMPEVGIGLFPDIGASFFLHKLPGQLGRYLALTGLRLTGAEVKEAGLATHCVHSSCIPQLETAVQALGPAARDLSKLNDLLCSFERSYPEQPSSSSPSSQPTTPAQSPPPGPGSGSGSASASSLQDTAGGLRSSLGWKLPLINQHFSHDSVAAIQRSLAAAVAGAAAAGNVQPEAVAFLQQAHDAMQRSSSLSQCVTFEMLQRSAHMGLEACLSMELAMAANFVSDASDFYEGVRATLIDKGSTPQWKYGSPDEVPQAAIDKLFAARPDVCMFVSKM